MLLLQMLMWPSSFIFICYVYCFYLFYHCLPANRIYVIVYKSCQLTWCLKYDNFFWCVFNFKPCLQTTCNQDVIWSGELHSGETRAPVSLPPGDRYCTLSHAVNVWLMIHNVSQSSNKLDLLLILHKSAEKAHSVPLMCLSELPTLSKHITVLACQTSRQHVHLS